MGVQAESGFLVLADLTGYTAYLSRSEIEHAPTIAGDLLETIVGRLEPPFRLAKLEGDAAFLWAEDGRADGSLFLDALEASYLAFRRRLRSIEQATTCDCNSCRLAPRLDLKLFVHHGAFVRSRIAGRDELAGRDVIVVHRLLKGAAAATSRSHGFLLVTDPAAAQLGLEAEDVELLRGEEEIEHLGTLGTVTIDLEARWQTETFTRRLADEGAVVLDLSCLVPADAATVWAHLTSPALRARWEGAIRIEDRGASPRRGIGTVTECVTGRLATLEEIVDWQPYDHVGWRIAVPGLGAVNATYDLEAADGGTRVRLCWRSQAEAPPDAASIRPLREDKESALARLAAMLGSQLPVAGPVMETQEVSA